VRVGKNQIRTLIVLGSPTTCLLVPGPDSLAMVKRGLLRQREPGKGSVCISPLGLRVLADEMEAGRVDDALERMRKDVEKRQAEIAAKRAAKQSAGLV
jgi:hypothetical protein